MPDTFAEEIQNLEHTFRLCSMVGECHEEIIEVLNSFLDRDVKYIHLVHSSFNHRNKKRLICALWFGVKMMFCIFHGKCLNKYQLLKDRIKEINWNLNLNRKIGSFVEMVKMRDLLMNRVGLNDE